MSNATLTLRAQGKGLPQRASRGRSSPRARTPRAPGERAPRVPAVVPTPALAPSACWPPGGAAARATMPPPAAALPPSGRHAGGPLPARTRPPRPAGRETGRPPPRHPATRGWLCPRSPRAGRAPAEARHAPTPASRPLAGRRARDAPRATPDGGRLGPAHETPGQARPGGTTSAAACPAAQTAAGRARRAGACTGAPPCRASRPWRGLWGLRSNPPTQEGTGGRQALAYRLWHPHDRQPVPLPCAALVSSVGYLPLYLLCKQ
jgi:hypothetical protein